MSLEIIYSKGAFYSVLTLEGEAKITPESRLSLYTSSAYKDRLISELSGALVRAIVLTGEGTFPSSLRSYQSDDDYENVDSYGFAKPYVIKPDVDVRYPGQVVEKTVEVRVPTESTPTRWYWG